MDSTPEQRGERSQRVELREADEENFDSVATVGHALRSARLARGDDVATVSRALRIRRDHIEAIEDGRLEALPGRAYAVGFVKSYARYLGLDAAACAERYKREMAGRSDAAPQIGPPPPELASSRMPSGWTIMAVLVVGVVLYGGWHLARTADVLTSQAVAPVPPRLVAPPSGSAAAPRPSHLRQAPLSASTPAPVANSPTPAAVASTAAVPAAVAGAHTPTAASTSKEPALAPPRQPAASDSAANGQPTQPQGLAYGAKNVNSRVVLHVRSDTHLLVQGPDGTVYINRILHPGDSYRVPDVVGLSLTAQDGGAVSLELDGQNMGAVGKAGAMADALSLDPQAIVDRAHGTNPG